MFQSYTSSILCKLNKLNFKVTWETFSRVWHSPLSHTQALTLKARRVEDEWTRT